MMKCLEPASLSNIRACLNNWPGGRAAGLFAGLAALSLGSALVSQYVFGLYPCVLCIYQRIPFAVVIGLAILNLGLRRPHIILKTMAACFAVGSGIAAFHTGVEQHWWAGTDACGLKLDTTDLEAIRQQIMNAPRARCDEIPWSFLGISMAGYNVAWSAFLAIGALVMDKKIA